MSKSWGNGEVNSVGPKHTEYGSLSGSQLLSSSH